MSFSLFPKYIDKAIDFADIRTSPAPVTPWSASVFNYLASRMMQTQMGLGYKFGDHSDLDTDHGVSGIPETFQQNLQARVRFEMGTVAGSSGSSVTVNFTHTTNGGSDQRFSASTSDLRIFVMLVKGDGSNPGKYWTPPADIATDSSGYPYQFKIRTENSINSSDEFEWFAIQGWG